MAQHSQLQTAHKRSSPQKNSEMPHREIEPQRKVKFRFPFPPFFSVGLRAIAMERRTMAANTTPSTLIAQSHGSIDRFSGLHSSALKM